jgi:hypothetical protein
MRLRHLIPGDGSVACCSSARHQWRQRCDLDSKNYGSGEPEWRWQPGEVGNLWWLGNPSPINMVIVGARIVPSAWVRGAAGPRQSGVRHGRLVQGLGWEHEKLWLHLGVIYIYIYIYIYILTYGIFKSLNTMNQDSEQQIGMHFFRPYLIVILVFKFHFKYLSFTIFNTCFSFLNTHIYIYIITHFLHNTSFLTSS